MALLHLLWCSDIYLVTPLSGKFFLEITWRSHKAFQMLIWANSIRQHPLCRSMIMLWGMKGDSTLVSGSAFCFKCYSCRSLSVPVGICWNAALTTPNPSLSLHWIKPQKKSLQKLWLSKIKSSRRHLSITSEPAAQNKQGRGKLLPRGPQKIMQNVKSISELHMSGFNPAWILKQTLPPENNAFFVNIRTGWDNTNFLTCHTCT